MEYCGLPWDNEFAYTGIRGGSIDEVERPIVFVHGNSRDEQDWVAHFEALKTAGFNMSDLWAIGFNNSNLTHTALAAQLEDFVSNLCEVAGVDEVSIVGHSLGVTVGRWWMHKYDRYENVSVFVGLAGANHGLDVCGFSKIAEHLPSSHKYKPCQSLGRSFFYTPLIEALNDKIGETPGDVRYYTIRGSRDDLYTGCIDSPRLEGAEENVLLDADHDEVRESEESIQLLCEWLANR